MTPRTDDELLESIVAGVLDRLRGSSAPVEAERASGAPRPVDPWRPDTRNSVPEAPAPERAEARPPEPALLPERVVTEAVLEAKLNGAKAVRFAPKAVLTPTARDYLRANGIEWAYADRSKGRARSAGGATWAALVVRSTPAVERALAELLPGVRKELLGCPDDAAELAITEVARGGVSGVIVFAEQIHRAACLANRHEAVKAVAVRDAAEAAMIRKQLRANVWCLDPTGRGYFELRNLVRAIKADT